MSKLIIEACATSVVASALTNLYWPRSYSTEQCNERSRAPAHNILEALFNNHEQPASQPESAGQSCTKSNFGLNAALHFWLRYFCIKLQIFGC